MSNSAILLKLAILANTSQNNLKIFPRWPRPLAMIALQIMVLNITLCSMELKWKIYSKTHPYKWYQIQNKFHSNNLRFMSENKFSNYAFLLFVFWTYETCKYFSHEKDENLHQTTMIFFNHLFRLSATENLYLGAL